MMTAMYRVWNFFFLLLLLVGVSEPVDDAVVGVRNDDDPTMSTMIDDWDGLAR